MKNFACTFGINNKIKQKNKSILSSNSNKNIAITQEEFQNISAENLDKFKKELFKNTMIDEVCRNAVLDVLCARYVSDEEEFEKIMKNWKKNKKTFSQKIQETIISIASIANIGSFILQLLNL